MDLIGVTAPARNDAWALGEYFRAGADALWRWHGNRWSRVTLPAPYAQILANQSGGALTAPSPDDVWVWGAGTSASAAADGTLPGTVLRYGR